VWVGPDLLAGEFAADTHSVCDISTLRMGVAKKHVEQYIKLRSDSSSFSI